MCTASVLIINNLYLLQHSKGSINYRNEPLALFILVVSIMVMFILIYLIIGNYTKWITQIRYSFNKKDQKGLYGIKNALRESVNKKELQVEYQPIVSLTTECVSLETLVRWRYKGNWVSPTVFVPLIEEMGLIEELTRQVAFKVLQDWSFWKEEIPELTHISLNISPLMLQSDEPSSFLDELLEGLDSRGIQPQQICFAITENVLWIIEL